MAVAGQDQFAQAVAQVQAGRGAGGIGTLGEKTLHAVLKAYCEPHTFNHEIKVGPFVADIVGEEGIMEIQTRSFDRLRAKLDAFLPVAAVTLVHPIPQVKWLSWVDPDTGEITSRRKSPKRGSVWDAFRELYKIKEHLCHPGLRLRFVLLEVEEYRLLNGWSFDRKRGSTRHERIPTALLGELGISSTAEYGQLLPATLPEQFTSRDFAKATKLTVGNAQRALNVLRHVGAVERGEKQGRLWLHCRVPG